MNVAESWPEMAGYDLSPMTAEQKISGLARYAASLPTLAERRAFMGLVKKKQAADIYARVRAQYMELRSPARA